MLTKYDLRKYKHIKAELGELEETIYKMRLSMTAPSVAKINGMPNGSGGVIGGNVVLKFLELEELYNAKKTKLLEMQIAIEKEIDKLDENERRLLRLHYFYGLTWEEAAVKMGFSWRHVHRMHNTILQKLGGRNE